MKEEKDLLSDIHRFFPSDEKDIRSFSPLKLAYLGDAVFEIIIRTLIIEETEGRVKHLHKRSSELVNAASQARLITAIQDNLTEEESAIFRHGRNAKASSVAKNANIHDYRNATGLESLFGYLYLTGNMSRAIELLHDGFTKLNITI